MHRHQQVMLSQNKYGTVVNTMTSEWVVLENIGGDTNEEQRT